MISKDNWGKGNKQLIMMNMKGFKVKSTMHSQSDTVTTSSSPLNNVQLRIRSIQA